MQSISRLLKIYKKIHKFMDVLNYFTLKEWDFTNDNVKALHKKMTPEDRENFHCNMMEVCWDTYFQTYIVGIRVYLIKDPLDTLPEARVKWQRYIYVLTIDCNLHENNKAANSRKTKKKKLVRHNFPLFPSSSFYIFASSHQVDHDW